ncbi:hypothetical protein EDF62_2922 [Leucobacter luti]|uniref:Uncharacterized protein n=1 Tax=Leucobacter luti TaxID=340320 RepID=A0A4R6RTZ1_9MICO|nr:hypothetical protein EDF62_2922 [Leucobacter luti]
MFLRDVSSVVGEQSSGPVVRRMHPSQLLERSPNPQPSSRSRDRAVLLGALDSMHR